MPQDASHRPVSKHLREFAKTMRHKPTDAEAAMWRLLRDRRLSAFKFRRQVPFNSYILDLVCFEKKSTAVSTRIAARRSSRRSTFR